MSEFSHERESSLEMPKDYITYVEKLTGLKINRIPNIPSLDLPTYSIMSSDFGDLVYVTHMVDGKKDGREVAYLINRSSDIPPADADADGLMGAK